MCIKYLFIYLILCSFLSTAQNNLLVLDENGKKFFLFVDDKQINDSAQAEVKAAKIYDDTCRIKAIFSDKTIPEFSGKVYLTENGKNVSKRDFTYRVSRQKNKPRMDFVSVNYALSDTNAKSLSPETKIKAIFLAEEKKKESYNRQNEIYPEAQPCKKAISDSLFQKNILTLKDNHIELNRIKDTKWFISNNCINTLQLKQLILFFDYRNSKVTIAEFAFDYMEDHRNFLEVVNGFEASAEKEELKKFYDKRIEK